jgi:flagellin
MTVINSNSAAMLTANSINQNDRAMTSTMERLSTGKRINSAADDAAGLAIATKMTSQIRGLDQAGRNANNATSMVQLADGAAEQVSNILQRMREIVVQAADGSNSASDVAVLNVEFKEAASEVDRIVDSTEFNGKKLLDGSAGGANSSVTFQIGANASQTLTVDFSDFNLNAGGTANAAAVSTAGSTSVPGVLTYTLDVTSQIEGEAIKLGDVSYEVTGSETDNTDLVAALNASSDSSLSQFTFSGTTTVIATADTPATTGTVTASTLDNIRVVTGPMEVNLVSFSTTGMGSDFDAALNNIDNAISGVATQRATFGATMNRLEYAVDNLASASLATATARGRIEDANYATETTALARSQIIAQAGTAMLAQANQKSQSVLSLLQ